MNLLDNLVGQQKIKDTILILLEACSIKKDFFPHSIILGPSGCGKSFLANCIAQSVGSKLHVYNSNNIKADGIYGILSEIESGDILFLDEIHSLHKNNQESLYHVMDSGRFEIKLNNMVLDSVDVAPFTLIGASTSSVKQPMLNRFKHVFELDDYSDEDMCTIINKYCKAKNVNFNCEYIVPYCRETPRIAQNIVDWIDNYVTVNNISNVTEDVIRKCLDYLNIGPLGLTQQDIKYLKFLNENKRTVGITSITGYMNLDKYLIENKIEPYLLKKRLIFKTPTGRLLNKKVYDQVEI